MSSEICQSQNFIDNPLLVTILLNMTNVSINDLVVEVGSGTGVITKQLAEKAETVIAIEQDSDLARKLIHNVARQHPNVQVVWGDFLDYSLPNQEYKVVANIPFNLTADIIRKLFMGQENQPDSAYLIMQKEAAEKFIGEPKATLTSTLLGISFEVSILSRINRRAFVPTPRVDAAFVAFIKKHEPLVDGREMGDFQDFVAYGYVHTQRSRSILDSFEEVFTPTQRKTMEKELDLEGMGIGDLDITHWVSMFETFKKYAPQNRKIVVRGSMTKLAREQSQLPKVHRTRRW